MQCFNPSSIVRLFAGYSQTCLKLKLTNRSSQCSPNCELWCKSLSYEFSVQFRNQFRDYKGQATKGLPFSADFFYDTLEKFNPLAINFQEDAQEYLSWLLNEVHEELIKELEGPAKPARRRAVLEDDEDDDGWQQVVAGTSKAAAIINVSHLGTTHYREFNINIDSDET